MSIRVQTLVWERSALAGTDLLLLLAVADQAGDEGRAWPALDTLQSKLRFGTRQGLLSCIERVIQSGELEKVRQTRADGGDANNHYQINVDALRDREQRYFYSKRERDAAHAAAAAAAVSTPVDPPRVNASRPPLPTLVDPPGSTPVDPPLSTPVDPPVSTPVDTKRPSNLQEKQKKEKAASAAPSLPLEQAPPEPQAADAAGAAAPLTGDGQPAEQPSIGPVVSDRTEARGKGSAAPLRMSAREALGQKLYKVAAFEETRDGLDRDEWRAVSPERVFELRREAQAAVRVKLPDGDNITYPTALIQLLDREIGSTAPLKWEAATESAVEAPAVESLDIPDVPPVRVRSSAKPAPAIGMVVQLDGVKYKVLAQMTPGRWTLQSVSDPDDERDVTLSTWDSSVRVVR